MSDDMEARQAKIREHAYKLWEEGGRREDAAEEHWHRARDALEQQGLSGAPDDQLDSGFPAGDPSSLTGAGEDAAAKPAAPEDEAAPALSATLEEAPTEPGTAAPSPKAAAKPRAPRARKKAE